MTDRSRRNVSRLFTAGATLVGIVVVLELGLLLGQVVWAPPSLLGFFISATELLTPMILLVVLITAAELFTPADASPPSVRRFDKRPRRSANATVDFD